MAKATRGSNSQFTYDFGIAISQSAVSSLVKLTGATLSLASAFYALKSTAAEYVQTLRENTFQFGGILGTMKAMEQAQDRLIKGQSYFSVDDQLRGMKQLMAAGVNVKDNLDWISKAAHASGQSLSQFSGAISSAIAGNMGQLVDMGLLTQRATRMFDKYTANTINRQKAILNFVKNHKMLMAAIRNDFYTVQDQMKRINATWKAFLQSILGRPNDPSSFYGQTARSVKLVADALARNLEHIKRVGYVIGSVLGWVVKQVGHFVVWLGRQVKGAIKSVWSTTDNYVEATRSAIVWLEFWKLKIVDFFKEYSGAIKFVLKLLAMYKAMKWVFFITAPIIASVKRYYKAIKSCIALQQAYIAFQGPYINKVARWFQSLAVWMPRPFRRAWVASGKFLGLTTVNIKNFLFSTTGLFKTLGRVMVAPFSASARVISGLIGSTVGLISSLATGIPFLIAKVFGSRAQILATGRAYQVALLTLKKGLFTIQGAFVVIRNAARALMASLMTNPFGWLVVAIAAVVTLYKKFEGVRRVVNATFSWIMYILKLIWNAIYVTFVGLYKAIRDAGKWFWNEICIPVATFFKNAVKWCKDMWKAFMDSSVGRFLAKVYHGIKSIINWVIEKLKWIYNKIIKPISDFFEYMAYMMPGGGGASAYNALQAIKKGAKVESLNDAAKRLSEDTGIPDLTFDTSVAPTADDTTDYLDPSNWGGKEKDNTPQNPIMDVNDKALAHQGGGNITNTMTFDKGAIQIIVEKGEGIDENKLAKKVLEVIQDYDRARSMRGGTV